ncbi:modular serine protease [Orussus abietinus]|uniref:modular serine protease n=1 Tax=Orussus abietinus TaxID=222816 RepID=UPI0006269151|nr:modular serine protease [Orussus abietinus]
MRRRIVAWAIPFFLAEFLIRGLAQNRSQFQGSFPKGVPRSDIWWHWGNGAGKHHYGTNSRVGGGRWSHLPGTGNWMNTQSSHWRLSHGSGRPHPGSGRPTQVETHTINLPTLGQVSLEVRLPPGINWSQQPNRDGDNHQPNQNYNQPNQNYNQPNQNYNQPNQSLNQPNQSNNQPNQNNNQPDQNYNQPNQNNIYICQEGSFKCANGECFPQSVRCDNVPHCRDSSDEINCLTSTPPTEQVNVGSTEEPIDGCVLPDVPRGGTYELGGCGSPCIRSPGDKVPRNSILTYTCNEGYTLSGNAISFCLNDDWYMPPTCLKTCPPLNSKSVDISCTHQGTPVSCNVTVAPGTRASLACKHSYKLPVSDDPGYREVQCLPEGIWDRNVFRCLPECGISIPRGTPMVIHGFNAKLGIFPWHVGVYHWKGDFYEQICAGSLISHDLVVSAAHCFYDEATDTVQDPSNFAVAAGKHFRDWDASEKYAQKSEIERIEVADRYIGAKGNFAQDIALIKLRSPLQLTALIRPVCIDWDNGPERQQLHVGQSGKVVGWGKTEDGVLSEELREINLPFVPYGICTSTVPVDFRGFVTVDKFCAGRLNGSALCEGDSGGGLCFEKDGLWYLRGIVSVSPVKDNDCDPDAYSAFTDVSHFMDWIRTAYILS